MATPPTPPPAPASLSHSSTTDDESAIVDTGAYNEMPHEEEPVAVASEVNEDEDADEIPTIAKVSVQKKPALVNSPSSSEESNDGPLMRPTALFWISFSYVWGSFVPFVNVFSIWLTQ